MILTKTDLLPHVEFDPKLALENARKVHPEIEQIEMSSRTGEGFPEWMGWLAGLQEKVQREALAAIS
jgi:hydrogenase nickel incorporation protein HypB